MAGLIHWGLFLLLLLTLLPSVAQTEITAPEITVGSEIDFPPYAIVDANGRASGFSVELLEAVADAMGLSVKVNSGPWPEVLAAFKAGKHDLLPLVALSPQRADMATYTRPHTVAYDSFFVRKGSPPVSSLSEAKGKEVIVMSSDAAHEALLHSGVQAHIIETKTISEAMRLLAAGRHDAVLVPKLLGLIVLRELKLEGIIESGKPVADYNRKFAFAVQRGNTELRDKLEQGLAIVHTNGRYDAIYKKWFGGVDYLGRQLKTIIVNNYNPYTFMNDKGEPDGFSVEIARAAARAMGLELEIRADNWDQAMKALEAGSIDLLPMMAQSPERDILFDFSVPHTIAYDAIFLKKGNTDIRTLNDLTGKTVIVMNRDIAHSYLLSSGLSKTMKLNLVDSLPEALMQLSAGKGDAAIMPKLVGIVTAKKLNLSDIETSPQLVDAYTRPFSFAVRDGNQALLERLNQGLNIIKSSGEYDAIYKKWFGALEEPLLVLKTLLKYVVVAALLLLGFFMWSIMLKRQVNSKTTHLEKEIAGRKLLEEELRFQSEIMSNMAEAVYLIRMEDGVIVYANSIFEKMFGYGKDELIGKHVSVVNAPSENNPEETAREIMGILTEKGSWQGEVNNIRKDGTPFWCYANVSLFEHSKFGKVLVSVHTDVTERKQSDVMLRDSEEKYRLLVNNLSSGVVVHAPDSSVLFSNPMASTLLGLTNDQMRGKEAMDSAWSFLRENGMALPLAEYPVNRVLSSGEPIANQVLGIRRPDLPEPVWVQCNAYPVTAADGALLQVVVAFSDITERKRDKEIIEKRLVSLTQPLESGSISFEELFSINELQHIQDAFAEATGVASIITAPDGIPLTSPSNFCRLCNDIIRKSEKGLANCIKSDSVLGKCNPSGPIVQPCISGGLWDGGASITVGGRHIANWLIGQVRNEELDEAKMLKYADEIDVDRELFKSALAEVPVMSRERFEKVALALYLLANELSLKAYQNIQQARFIAERKIYEKDLQQKNAELERFTYTVSHDLKSPIITIKGFTGSLAKDIAMGNYERMPGDLKRVSDAADRMNELLRDLLELSTIGRIVKDPEQVDMNLLAADVLEQLAVPLKSHHLNVEVQPALPTVFCDRRRMLEVLQNLVENAINYMGEQTDPQIRFGMREKGGENIFFVQDNGIGIDEKYHHIIFGLFNKLDTSSEGTGIGLALVKRIIEVHGGKVWVESEGVGKGSTFCFTLKETR